MGVRYSIDLEKKLNTFYVTGIFTLKEMSVAYEALFSDPAYDPDFNTLSLFDEAEHLGLEYSEIGEIRAIIKKFDTRRGKVAMVFGTSTGRYMWGKLAVLQFNLLKSNPYRAFKSREDALDWLNS